MYDKRPALEIRACRKLVKAILATGKAISVYDGEEWAVKFSTKFSDIIDALGNTDTDSIIVRDAEKNLVGRFYLVWGNDPDGSELIADHSDNAYCNYIYSEVYPQ